MAEPMDTSHILHPSSQGHALASAGWLDAHFDCKRPEYELILRSVGIRRGWHVLDAGAGSGSFLRVISEEVGPTGRITALDLAPENVEVIEQRLADVPLECPVETQQGDLMSLPFPDDLFDAAWCANTTQYLNDDELTAAIGEMCRVVRPGGLVAIKEVSVTTWNFTPGDPARMWRLLDAVQDTDAQVHGLMRVPELATYLKRGGLQDVSQRTVPVERRQPLRASERQFIGEIIGWVARKAEGTALPEVDRAYWKSMIDAQSPEHPMNAEDFYHYEVQFLAVGRVPIDA